VGIKRGGEGTEKSRGREREKKEGRRRKEMMGWRMMKEVDGSAEMRGARG